MCDYIILYYYCIYSINFFRLVNIILGCVPHELRNIFEKKYKEIENTSWQPVHNVPNVGFEYLNDHFKQNNRKPLPYQIKRLKQTADPGDWDTSLLCGVLLGLEHPWKLSSDYISALESLRKMRNDFFAHPPHAAISSDKLRTVVVDTKNAYRKLLEEPHTIAANSKLDDAENGMYIDTGVDFLLVMCTTLDPQYSL